MMARDNRTPEESWAGARLPEAKPIRQNDPNKPLFRAKRSPFRGDANLPRVQIAIIRSVQRIA